MEKPDLKHDENSEKSPERSQHDQHEYITIEGGGFVGVIACGGELSGALLQAVEVIGAKVNVVELDVVFYVGTDGLRPLSR